MERMMWMMRMQIQPGSYKVWSKAQPGKPAGLSDGTDDADDADSDPTNELQDGINR